MLSYAKSATARTGDRLNGFKKGKTQQFNSGGVVKWAYFQKKWSIPLRSFQKEAALLMIQCHSYHFKHSQGLYNIKLTHFNKHIIFTIPQKSQNDSHCVTAACCERLCACCEGIDLVVREMISKIKTEQRSYR